MSNLTTTKKHCRMTAPLVSPYCKSFSVPYVSTKVNVKMCPPRTNQNNDNTTIFCYFDLSSVFNCFDMRHWQQPKLCAFRVCVCVIHVIHFVIPQMHEQECISARWNSAHYLCVRCKCAHTTTHTHHYALHLSLSLYIYMVYLHISLVVYSWRIVLRCIAPNATHEINNMFLITLLLSTHERKLFQPLVRVSSHCDKLYYNAQRAVSAAAPE